MLFNVCLYTYICTYNYVNNKILTSFLAKPFVTKIKNSCECLWEHAQVNVLGFEEGSLSICQSE